MSDEEAGSVDARTLAKLFDCTDRHIRDLAAEGIIPKTERGNYRLAACVRAYVQHLKGKTGTTRKGSIAEKSAKARLRKERADATRAELELAKEMKLVANVDDMERAWSSTLVEVKSLLRNIPGRVASMIVGEVNERRIKSVLRDEIDLCLVGLSKGGNDAEASEALDP